MSADNQLVIMPHPETDGFAVVMDFVSDDWADRDEYLRTKAANSPSYTSLGEAVLQAQTWMGREVVEYGMTVTHEARLRAEPEKNSWREEIFRWNDDDTVTVRREIDYLGVFDLHQLRNADRFYNVPEGVELMLAATEDLTDTRVTITGGYEGEGALYVEGDRPPTDEETDEHDEDLRRRYLQAKKDVEELGKRFEP